MSGCLYNKKKKTKLGSGEGGGEKKELLRQNGFIQPSYCIRDKVRINVVLAAKKLSSHTTSFTG